VVLRDPSVTRNLHSQPGDPVNGNPLQLRPRRCVIKYCTG
jgi:hypothetical protein